MVGRRWEKFGTGEDVRLGWCAGRWEPPTGRRCEVKGRRDGRCVRRPTFGLIGATSRALPAKYHLPCVFTVLVMWMKTAWRHAVAKPPDVYWPDIWSPPKNDENGSKWAKNWQLGSRFENGPKIDKLAVFINPLVAQFFAFKGTFHWHWKYQFQRW